MKILNVITISVLALTCTGCAVPLGADLYMGVPTSASSSNIIFTKGYKTNILGPATQEYITLNNTDCEETHRAAVFGNIIKEKAPRNIPFKSGQKIYVTAKTAYFITTSITPNGNGAAYTMGYVPCSNTASFTPMPGQSYTVSQLATLDDCKLSVLENTSNKVPEDLIEEANIACTPAEPPKSIWPASN